VVLVAATGLYPVRVGLHFYLDARRPGIAVDVSWGFSWVVTLFVTADISFWAFFRPRNRRKVPGIAGNENEDNAFRTTCDIPPLSYRWHVARGVPPVLSL
jgi:hypothetical protein